MHHRGREQGVSVALRTDRQQSPGGAFLGRGRVPGELCGRSGLAGEALPLRGKINNKYGVRAARAHLSDRDAGGKIKVGASGFYPHFVLLVSINRKIIELK